MGQRLHRFERDEYLTAKALYMAVRVYDLYPDELRPEADRADMARILHEQFPHHARLFADVTSEVAVI